MKSFFIFLAISLSVTLSTTAHAENQVFFRIIGENDLVLVKKDLSNVPQRFKILMPAIGKLSTGCTITHIGQGYALTAGHCFWQTFFDGDLKLNQPCTDETVTWMQTVDGAQPKVSKCLEIVAMQRNEDLNLDFAIMKVSEPPVEFVKVDWSRKPRPLQWLTVFSYPGEASLSWSKYCRLKKLTVDDVHPNSIHHVCDTEVGSSGAAILNAQNGKMIGMHLSGDGEFNPDGTMTEAIVNFGHYIVLTPIKKILFKNGFLF